MLLYQPKNGYCYNSDSIFLYDFLMRFNPKGKLLDIGCGVGILGIMTGRDFPVSVTMIDKQHIMIDYARLNSSVNNMDISIVKGDFLEYDFNSSFDFVISNPPFYGEGSLKSKDTVLNAARYSSHLPFDDMAAKIKSILRPRGYFIFCYDAKQISEVAAVLEANGLRAEYIRFIHSKIDRESKIVMIAARSNSRSACRVSAPLIVFDDEGEYTQEAAEAFRKASAHSVKADI